MDITLARLMQIARRRPLVLLAGMLGAAALVAALGSQAPRREASMTFLVGPIGGEYSQLRAAGQQAQTYAELATSGPVLEGASERLRGARTVAQLRGAIAADADFYTRLLTLTATARGRADALAAEAAVAAELQRIVRARGPHGGSQLTMVEPARIQPATAGAAKKLVVIAAFTGLLAALTLLVLREHATVGVLVVLAAAAAIAATPAAASWQPGLWLTRAEVMRLPMRGPAWAQLRRLADKPFERPDLSNQDSAADTEVLAGALVYARSRDERLRARVARALTSVIGTERGGRTLALARGLVSYVVAADLIDLAHYDRGRARAFRDWLAGVGTEPLAPADYPTLVTTHELRPNNWGTHAGASRIAADIYLRDEADLARAAGVFKGWLGDRSTYSGFRFGEDLSWQADPAAPVGVNPMGATRDGMSIDGALPDDMRRGCALRFPPCPTLYPWEAMQGAVVQAELLARQGYDAWNWGDQALRRAAGFLFGLHQAYGDKAWGAPRGDEWIPWLLNARYGTHFPTVLPARPGKGMGFTDWSAAACGSADCTKPRGGPRVVASVPAARPQSASPTHGAGTVAVALGVTGGLAFLVLLSVLVVMRRHGTRGHVA